MWRKLKILTDVTDRVETVLAGIVVPAPTRVSESFDETLVVGGSA